MKRLITLLFGFMTMTMSLMAAVTPTAPSVGDGSEGNPYKISSVANLQWMSDMVNSSTSSYRTAYYELTSDLDLSTYYNETEGSWTPIGNSSYAFNGHFNGNNHTIKHLYYNGDSYYVGLFGVVGGATICNLNLSNVDITSTNYYCGALIGMGYKADCTITNIHVTGNVTALRTCGGIAGTLRGLLEDCTNAATVTSTCTYSDADAGGLVGEVYNAEGVLNINRCANYGAVNCSYRSGAGIISSGSTVITNTLSAGNITASSGYCGGFVGCVNSSDVVIKNCLFKGTISTGYGDESSFFGASSYQGNPNVVPTLSIENSYACGSILINDKEKTGDRFMSGRCASLVYSIENCAELSTSELASGYAALMLQGTQVSTQWGQQLGVDAYPVPKTSNQVYINGSVSCTGVCTGEYTNTPTATVFQSHVYTDGICDNCNHYEKPEFTDNYFMIGNLGNLLWFRDKVNDGGKSLCAKLTADIDVSRVCNKTAETSWVPIHNSEYYDDGYEGIFDGQGHSVTGIYMNVSRRFVGFFGQIMCGTVKNLNLTVDITNTMYSSYTGGLAGRMYRYGEVSHITTNGTVSGVGSVGGIVGDIFINTTNQPNLVQYCTNNASVTGTSQDVGGIVGVIEKGLIQACVNTGHIQSKNINIGGIVGASYKSTIQDCWNKGHIEHTGYFSTNCNFGGIVGKIDRDTEVNYCLNSGNLSSETGSDPTAPVCFIAGDKQSDRVYHLNNCIALSTATITSYGGQPSTLENLCVAQDVAPTTHAFATRIMTPAQFSRGEVTYYLQDNRPELIWLQNLANDKEPVLNMNGISEGRIYPNGATISCNGLISGSASYSNVDAGTSTIKPHEFAADGVCDICSDVETPNKNAEDYYEIGKLGHLIYFANHINGSTENATAKAILTDDIDMSTRYGSTSNSWEPIGSYQEPFEGIFDGQGHKITSLYINRSYSKAGFFGGLGGYAKVINLELEGDVKCVQASAAILAASTANDGKSIVIDNCIVRGSVETTSSHSAGILAYDECTGKNVITNCKNYANIKTDSYAGGIVGYYYQGNTTIRTCENYGTINGSDYCGGIIGYAYNGNITTRACENLGTVNGRDYCGGIIGYAQNSYTITFNSCANEGIISGRSYVGGIGGYVPNGIFSQNFNNQNIVASSSNASPFIGSHNSGMECSNNYHNVAKTVKANNVDVDLSSEAAYMSVANATILASGEVAYKLGSYFGQELGKEAVPRLGGRRVFYGTYKCGATTPIAEASYTNEAYFDKVTSHKLDKYSKCRICHKHPETLSESVQFEDWQSTNQGSASSNSENTIDLAVTKDGKLTFDWKVSSESGCDWLIVELLQGGSVIKTFVNQASGETSGSESYDVHVGDYTLYMKYRKDSSVDKGEDTAWVTNIFIPGEIKVASLGDLTGNDVIDVEDMTMLIDVIKGEDHDCFKSGDINGDTKYNLLDVQALMNMILCK